ncbi:MAG: fatty acid desaturase [Phycisphaerales bacterium]|nr:fatty acid desaturase [Phycisphaerales bacterium]MCI0674398.1 fatty acid desaturase [Phycisphaerales bacterium]
MQDHAIHLQKPATVVHRIVWVYAVPITLIHLLALAAVLPWLFSWTGLITMLLGVHFIGHLGINIGYHRLLTHRSFRVPRWLEYTFVLLALFCLQDTPARWVANHRHHHNHSDTEPDPHTPLVSFFWSHVGWMLFHNSGIHNLSSYQKLVPDLIQDPFYLRLAKNPALIFWIYLAQIPLFLLPAMAIGYMTAPPDAKPWLAAIQFGLSLVVWGVIVRTVVVWHVTWSVNSLSHMFGYRNYHNDEHSMNNWLVAVMTAGEGWHNNHHHDPASACNQHRWWEFDITFWEIKILEKLGLATRVLPPRRQRQVSKQRPPQPSAPVG